MAPEDETSVEITENPAEHRFEIHYGDRLAGFTVYEVEDAGYAFMHTEIEPNLEGHGLASRLVRVAMDAMTERGVAVLPFCPYVASWLTKHPDHLDLVPADRRAGFGLPTG